MSCFEHWKSLPTSELEAGFAEHFEAVLAHERERCAAYLNADFERANSAYFAARIRALPPEEV